MHPLHPTLDLPVAWGGGEEAPTSPLQVATMTMESGMCSGPRPTNRVYPDRLVRVLAEGLRTIEARRAREQTESPNRAIMALPKSEVPSDEPAREH